MRWTNSHIVSKHEKHENTVLFGQRGAAACAHAAMTTKVSVLRFNSTHFSQLFICVYFFCLQERAHAQQREVLKKEAETSQKIAGQAYTQQYISELLKIASTPPITPEKGQHSFSRQQRCNSYIFIWISPSCFFSLSVLLIFRYSEKLHAMADVQDWQPFGDEKCCKGTLGQ